MALINSFEKNGNFLFKYRGQIPVILFIGAIPILYYTDFSNINSNLKLLLTIIAIITCLAGFLIRFYTIATTPGGTSGRNTEKQVAETVNTKGIYSIVRHPLYLGNYLIWIGIVLFTFNIYYFIIVSLAFWLYYERIMFAEERFLERKFGSQYLDWANKVPAFIPAFSKFVQTDIPFSLKSIVRREYSGVLATAIGFAFIDITRKFFTGHKIELSDLSIIFLIICIFLVFIILL
ncbi:MAG: DUF1295 domain-containing protein [Bacteroidales bacterium]|nr:DUF1295 domain-containing protein [Bacteroidales bacterium]